MTPTFKPLHPKFTGKFPINKNKNHSSIEDSRDLTKTEQIALVDLDRGICTCAHGHPFVQDGDKTWQTTYCIHKLKVLAKIAAKDPDELMWPYTKALSTRYNKYEVVSAFHKELRRGDYDRAVYWGLLLATSRGMKGVIKYLLNILYEETRDHYMGAYLLQNYKLVMSGLTPTVADVCNMIAIFCESKKKWEMPHRMAIFEAEMEGYKQLAAKYSYKVAQGKEIIPATEITKLTQDLLNGFKTADMVLMQRGLKGLFKSKSECSHEAHKDYIFSLLEKVMTGRYPNGFKLPAPDKPEKLHKFLLSRKEIFKEHGYHELNAFADLLAGEPYNAGLTGEAARNKIIARPKSGIKPGDIKQIPLYAQDNHTWTGKAYLRKHSWQLGNQVEQTDIDFRWCGAYLGVCYRYLAFKQHGAIEVPWETVKWPTALHNHVMKMFY